MTDSRLGIVVNPMSGRDVRRLAARASNMTHEAKRDLVARIAAGADAAGVGRILVAREPFRIAAEALAQMPLAARVEVVDVALHNDAGDTEQAVRAFLEAGCRTLVSLGGDGTNRAIVRTLFELSQGRDASTADALDVQLIALSTGTNNVFPEWREATVAGMCAGLLATGAVVAGEAGLQRRAKVLHVAGRGADGRVVTDVGLIDAVLLADDVVGNLLPFDPQRLRQLLLTRAEPTAVGMSPLGGLLEVVDAADDAALLVTVGDGAAASDGRRLRVPLSPGLFREVCIREVSRLDFGVAVPFRGPGVLALDGDRDHKLLEGGHLTVTVARDGPWLPDVDAVMRWGVRAGIMARAFGGGRS